MRLSALSLWEKFSGGLTYFDEFSYQIHIYIHYITYTDLDIWKASVASTIGSPHNGRHGLGSWINDKKYWPAHDKIIHVTHLHNSIILKKYTQLAGEVRGLIVRHSFFLSRGNRRDCAFLKARRNLLCPLHSGKSATILESNHGSGVCKEGALRVILYTNKLHFVSRNWRMEK